MGENLAPGFVIGFITGFITAGVIGFVVSKILWCWGRITAIGKPQNVKSTTDTAPLQVLASGCKALLLLITLMICVLVAILLVGSASIFGWEEVITFVMSVAQLQ